MDLSLRKNKHKYLGALILSLLFFLIRGVIYAWIGSYVPLIFVTVFVITFIYLLIGEAAFAPLIVKVWSWFLIIWGVIRLAIPMMFYIAPNVTESHIRSQFTVLEFLMSILAIGIGIYLFKKRTVFLKKGK